MLCNKSLESLALCGIYLEDLSFAADLTKLNNLILADTKIEDISAIAELSKLESITLYNNPITSYSPVKQLKKLAVIQLGNDLDSIIYDDIQRAHPDALVEKIGPSDIADAPYEAAVFFGDENPTKRDARHDAQLIDANQKAAAQCREEFEAQLKNVSPISPKSLVYEVGASQIKVTGLKNHGHRPEHFRFADCAKRLGEIADALVCGIGAQVRYRKRHTGVQERAAQCNYHRLHAGIRYKESAQRAAQRASDQRNGTGHKDVQVRVVPQNTHHVSDASINTLEGETVLFKRWNDDGKWLYRNRITIRYPNIFLTFLHFLLEGGCFSRNEYLCCIDGRDIHNRIRETPKGEKCYADQQIQKTEMSTKVFCCLQQMKRCRMILACLQPAYQAALGIHNAANHHERIQLTFGKEFGLTIHSALDEGTEVLIRLPILKEEIV